MWVCFELGWHITCPHFNTWITTILYNIIPTFYRLISWLWWCGRCGHNNKTIQKERFANASNVKSVSDQVWHCHGNAIWTLYYTIIVWYNICGIKNNLTRTVSSSKKNNSLNSHNSTVIMCSGNKEEHCHIGRCREPW